MATLLGLRLLALTLLAPAAPLLPILSSPGPRALSPADSSALHACFDPNLEALRAGQLDAPATLATFERAELASAQQTSSSLEALRAGSAPSDHEWTWLAIGAGIVLLIVLL